MPLQLCNSNTSFNNIFTIQTRVIEHRLCGTNTRMSKYERGAVFQMINRIRCSSEQEMLHFHHETLHPRTGTIPNGLIS